MYSVFVKLKYKSFHISCSSVQYRSMSIQNAECGQFHKGLHYIEVKEGASGDNAFTLTRVSATCKRFRIPPPPQSAHCLTYIVRISIDTFPTLPLFFLTQYSLFIHTRAFKWFWLLFGKGGGGGGGLVWREKVIKRKKTIRSKRPPLQSQ